jgi:Zn finger protein HypA/HybF involved in hydrogenase expression
MDLIERAEEIARRENARRVTQIEVAIGDLSGVDRESFAFVFPEAARDSLLSEALLVIREGTDREFQFVSMEVDHV